MLRRRRKMMMLRMMMWRRRTDPKTVTHSLCEPAAQSGHFRRATLRENLQETCRTFCASRRAQSTCKWIDIVTRAILCENFHEKCRTPEVSRACCASPHGRHVPGHATRAILCRNLQVKGHRPRAGKTRGADFARACAVETHMDISQAPFMRKFTRKMPGAQSASIKHQP